MPVCKIAKYYKLFCAAEEVSSDSMVNDVDIVYLGVKEEIEVTS